MREPPRYTWLAVLVLFQLFLAVNADVDPYGYTRDGCYTGLSGFTSMGQSASMSSYYCMNLCYKKGYAVAAVTSPGVCFCGAAIPAEQIDSSSCNFPCPAYPQEDCGGSNGAYNVFHYGDNVSTAASAAPSSTTSASSTSSATDTTTGGTTSATDTNTSSAEPQKTTSPSGTSSSDSAGGTSASSSSTSSSSHTAATAAGTTDASASATSSATETSSANSAHATNTASDAQGNHKSGGGLSGGAIAGIVVGVVCGIGAVAGIVAFILIRRRKDEFYSPHSSPSRFTDSGFQGGYNQNYPVIDPRLNPDLLGGDHRISIASLVDARDYSRQILKVVNPDEKY